MRELGTVCVRDPQDRRQALYWRVVDHKGKSVGMVEPFGEGWRASLYGKDPSVRVLGVYSTRYRAECAVEEAWTGGRR